MWRTLFGKPYERENREYIDKIPLKKDPACFGRYRDIAVRRLNSLWNKVIVDSDYIEMYKDFLTEYREMGHMAETIENEEQGTYFISPFRCISPTE